jgi:hypothetical protein
MSNTAIKKPNAVKAAWRRIKDRLKLSWIVWFYICARRTVGGSVLLILLFISLFSSSLGISGYLAERHYASWNELPCQTGKIVKTTEGRRKPPTITLVDDAGVEHKLYAPRYLDKTLYGQSVKVCFTSVWEIYPPFFYRDAKIAFLPPDSKTRLWDPHFEAAESIAFSRKLAEISLLWFAFPIVIWLLKRHAREAWRVRRSHLDSLSKPQTENIESLKGPSS